jgi:hypothetical protein
MIITPAVSLLLAPIIARCFSPGLLVLLLWGFHPHEFHRAELALHLVRDGHFPSGDMAHDMPIDTLNQCGIPINQCWHFILPRVATTLDTTSTGQSIHVTNRPDLRQNASFDTMIMSLHNRYLRYQPLLLMRIANYLT